MPTYIVINFILSVLLINLGLPINGFIFFQKQVKELKNGLVMGVSEADNNLNNSIVAAAEDIKSLSLPQLADFDPLKKTLPESQDKEEADKIIEYDLPAENGAILNCRLDDLSYAKRPDRQWPIASITKLFTAYTFLDYNPGWETNLTIKPEDRREGGKIYLFNGDTVKVEDLFYFSLVGSDNTATAAMVRSTGLSEEEFVEKINEKIRELGLKNTRIVDPVGLKDGNISTAREVAKFAKIALANQEIRQASATKKYEFTTSEGRKKTVTSTNELLSDFSNGDVNMLGGKTGHVNSSGYCFVGQFEDQEGESIVTVVLGADSDSSRFDLTKKLVDLYYSRKQ